MSEQWDPVTERMFDLAKPEGADELYEVGREVVDLVNKALILLRQMQGFSPEAREYYGGVDYGRHLSLAITNIEQGLLWAGGVLPPPDSVG